MNRRLLNLLTAVSLLLFVSTSILWVRSYFVADLWDRELNRDETPGESVTVTTEFMSSSGGLVLIRDRRVRSGDPRAVSDLDESMKNHPSFKVNNGWSRTTPYGYPSPRGSHTLGFAWVHNRHDHSFPTAYRGTIHLEGWNAALTLPYWFLAGVTGIWLVPAGLALRRRMRRRWRAGRDLCPACGYDLRATPGKCPECGWEKAGEREA